MPQSSKIRIFIRGLASRHSRYILIIASVSGALLILTAGILYHNVLRNRQVITKNNTRAHIALRRDQSLPGSKTSSSSNAAAGKSSPDKQVIIHKPNGLGLLNHTGLGRHPTTSSTVGAGATFFGAIDTMKDSRDTDYPTGNQMSLSEIKQETDLTVRQGVNYITDDAFYDYPSYMREWADTIHTAGRSVWFRPQFNCWGLNNGCNTQMTPNGYISALTSFLNANYAVFRSGDIFDPCPEPEDSAYWASTYGDNWSWQNAPNAGTNEYNNFMLDVSQTAQSVLRQHGVTGVITGVRSTNSWWPQNPNSLYRSTIKALGYVTYDSYPEGTTTDPATATGARIMELNKIIADNPGTPVVLGEFGYSNSIEVSDATQQAVLSAEVKAILPYSQIVGLNYWVGAGGSGYGGYTNIFTGSRGDWQPRPAAAVMAGYFAEKIH